MATEILAVPEENLREVIRVIRYGVAVATQRKQISSETRKQLLDWCNEETEYLEQE